tara:strand:- start:257 stop:730 length:474 start_codon:yes stop_codon:yes gene_type:complete
MRLSEDIAGFISRHGVVLIATMGVDGKIHCSVKGIAGVNLEGKVFVVDLFKFRTYKNLRLNPMVSITTYDEKKFKGYTLQGEAKIINREDIKKDIILEWDRRTIKRISERVISNLRAEAEKDSHHEAELPHQPQYLIEVSVNNIIDLAPPIYRKKDQ